jgi:hypothetical protein
MLVGERLRPGELGAAAGALAGAAGTPVELGDRESAMASGPGRAGGSLLCDDATRAASSSTS